MACSPSTPNPHRLDAQDPPLHPEGRAGGIRCDMLVVDSEDDKDMPGQARQLYAALKGPKEFMLFTREEGAGEHCQIGAAVLSNARILDWLDGKMKAAVARPKRK